MKPFPTNFQDATQPLTESMITDEADKQATRELAEKGYEVHTGLTIDYATQISEMCLEPSIKEFCPNDSGKRFTNRQVTENWLSKGRAVFLLLKRDNDNLDLAGYGWTGPATSSHVPGGETTFAPRIGEAGQGHGLATPYSRLIIAGTAQLYGSENFWLETWQSNGAAVHIYHKMGFVDVDQTAAERPTAGGEKVADVRLFMSLPNELLPAKKSV